MRHISEYLFEKTELTNEQLDDTAYQVAATVTAMQAFGDYSGSSSDEPGIIRSIIDSIKDKREQKIVAKVLEKIYNDKDIKDLLDNADKKYIEMIKDKTNKLKNNLRDPDAYLKEMINNRDTLKILQETDTGEQMVELIKSKLDKKELKYFNKIYKEIILKIDKERFK